MSAHRGSTGLTAGGVKKALSKQVDSEFNTVARIVFGTAKRAGVAVSRDDRVSAEDDYVKQLLRFQQHSKKKGGSLSRLSLNVASVMAKTSAEEGGLGGGTGHVAAGGMRKKMTPSTVVRGGDIPGNLRSSARDVPSLGIPFYSEGGGRQSAATLAALKKAGMMAAAQQPIVVGGAGATLTPAAGSLDLKLPFSVTESMRLPRDRVLEQTVGEAEKVAARKQELMAAAAAQSVTSDAQTSRQSIATTPATSPTPAATVPPAGKKPSVFQKLMFDISPEAAPDVGSTSSTLQAQQSLPDAASISQSGPPSTTVPVTSPSTTAASAMATSMPQPRVKVASGKANIASPTSIPSPSVTVKPAAKTATSAADWMAQREREFEETREKERKDAEAMKEQAMVNERNAAAAQWVLDRNELAAGYFEPVQAIKNYEVVKNIFLEHSQNWEGALTKLQELADEANSESTSKVKVSDNVVSLAAHTLARTAHPNTSAAMLEELRTLCDEHKIDRSVMNDAEIMSASKNHDGEAVVAMYDGMKGIDFVKLQKPSLYSMISNCTNAGGWRKGLDALENIKGHVADSYCMLELAMVRSLTTSGGLIYERRAALDWVERTIRDRMGDLGKLHAIHLVLARCALKNFDSAKTIVHEFERRNEVDESLYGGLVSIRSEHQRGVVEKMMADNNFTDTDPAFIARKIAALVRSPFKASKLGTSGETEDGATSEDEQADVDGAFTLLMRWKEGELQDAEGRVVPFSWNITLLNSVFGMLEHSGDSTLIDMCLDGLSSLERIYKIRKRDRGLLYMAFISEERYEDLIAFQEVRCPLGVREVFSFDGEKNYNIALKAMDREPYSGLVEEDRDRVEGARFGPRSTLPGAGDSASGGGTLVIPDNEKMMKLARDETKWKEALSVLGQARIPQGVTMTEEESTRLTVAYNAGINVSMKQGVDIMEKVYASMLANKIKTNATTHNTLMSTYASTATTSSPSAEPSSLWLKALTEFQSMDTGKKDVNSFSILLSLLSKKNLWEEATNLMTMLRASPTITPNPIVFTLMINAVHKYSWAVALSNLRDLHKNHGTDAIKEKTKGKVVRALEAAGKEELVLKLNALLAGKKQKKGTDKKEKVQKKKEKQDAAAGVAAKGGAGGNTA